MRVSGAALRDWNDSSSMSISLRIWASITISLSGIFRYSALTASPPPFPAACSFCLTGRLSPPLSEGSTIGLRHPVPLFENRLYDIEITLDVNENPINFLNGSPS